MPQLVDADPFFGLSKSEANTVAACFTWHRHLVPQAPREIETGRNFPAGESCQWHRLPRDCDCLASPTEGINTEMGWVPQILQVNSKRYNRRRRDILSDSRR